MTKQAEQVKHTATPWSFNGYVDIFSSDTHIGSIKSIEGFNEQSQANAEFIVKAVNNHNALVEALDNLVKFQCDASYRVKLCGAREYEAGHWSALLDQAKQALAQAKGE